MRKSLRRLVCDTGGNFTIMAACLMTLVIGCAALGVDIGSIFADRRRSQGAADLAAIVAASNLGKANAAAVAAVVNNHYPASALVSVELGTYTADAALAPSARFVTPATGAANAARVRLSTATPLYFARYFTGADQYTINTTATAACTAQAAFAIGSRLLSLNGGLLNAMLGSMLGTTLSLSVMDYQSLLDVHVDAFAFLNALATRLDLTAVTYDSLLSTNVKLPDIIDAMKLAGGTSASMALNQLASSLAGLTTKITLSSLIDLGPYADLTVGDTPKLGVAVSLFDLLSAVAQVANGQHQIATALNLGLPGIASVSLTATVGERPQGSNWLTVGMQGASVHTAQTRVLLMIQLVGSGSVSVVNLPVYIEIASGTATLNKVDCSYPDRGNSSATLGVTPGIVDAWIGNVSVADLNNFSTKPNPGPATLVDLTPLPVKVSGRAHAGMGNTAPTAVSFSYADIAAHSVKTVTTTNFTSSLTASLLGDLSLNVQVGPLGLPIPGLGATVAGILSGATGPIDQLLAGVLATLGIGIGQADVWVSGIRCDGAVLVN